MFDVIVDSLNRCYQRLWVIPLVAAYFFLCTWWRIIPLCLRYRLFTALERVLYVFLHVCYLIAVSEAVTSPKVSRSFCCAKHTSRPMIETWGGAARLLVTWCAPCAGHMMCALRLTVFTLLIDEIWPVELILQVSIFMWIPNKLGNNTKIWVLHL